MPLAASRRFGVEIECGLLGGTAEAVAVLEAAGLGDWCVGEDGSGVEATTPILQGPSGFRTLRLGLSALVDGGAFVSSADGLHVHHDAPDYVDDEDATERLQDSWINIQDVVERFVAPQRRGDTSYNRKWDPADKHLAKDWVHRRHNLNLSTLTADDYGTIEFRMMEGCLNFEDVRAWIRFGQSLLHACKHGDKPLPKVRNKADLLTCIHAAPMVRKRLLLRRPKDNPPLSVARSAARAAAWR